MLHLESFLIVTILEVLLIVILSGSPIHRVGSSFDCDTPLQCFNCGTLSKHICMLHFLMVKLSCCTSVSWTPRIYFIAALPVISFDCGGP